VVSGLARTSDVFPTILDLLCFEPPGSADGVSLVPAFTRRGGTQVKESYCETYHTRLVYGWSELVGLRTREWKYVWSPKPELYDLRQDPGETRNLIAEYPEVAREMERQVVALRREPGGIDQTAVSRETKAKLRTLGYLEEEPPMSVGGSRLPSPRDMIESYNRRQDAKKAVQKAARWVREGESDSAAADLRRAMRLDPEGEKERVGDFERYLRDAGIAKAAREAVIRRVKYLGQSQSPPR
jgi:hypothetical protein